jgi:outer membrane immunogenic protein
MKRLLIACIGVLGCAVISAQAADIPARYPAPYRPVYAPMYTWTGFYVGINGGGGWGRSQWDGIDRFNISGGMIGATVGYSWQINQFVVGAEGDIDWSGVKGNTNFLCPTGCETRNSWLATARARVGYGVDRFLPYLTGGLAFGDIRASVPGFPGGSITNAGWTLGGGLEFAVAPNVSIKGEYLYVDLGNFNCGFNCGLLPGSNVSLFENLFRAGLNVRF